MKLRIQGNSLRLRISRPELAQLARGEELASTIYFGMEESAWLTYRLAAEAAPVAISARYEPQQVTVVLAEDAVQHWAATDEVGIYGSTPTAAGPLQLTVEKDFACLDRSDADNADAFPHPGAGAAC